MVSDRKKPNNERERRGEEEEEEDDKKEGADEGEIESRERPIHFGRQL